MVVTSLMWLIRLANNAVKVGSFRQAYNSLPSFHIRVMWAPGCLAGALYSIGNFSSILAISTLGDFLGYSLGQASLLVSGLWGIFWYREIKKREDILGWLISCGFVIVGIIGLSLEHVQ
uniref:EamA domain-containing protein n=1 Tax=Minutocellus polymorphus TaxID=265543 RepID=A0A7S0AM59_9STRA|mmetsp:Transcript_17683/g.29393  ORF Transcript_17683/g.29393 Transcript_17683/m.29393 type:complete len:119 (+) Transcript_17683:2-358(+)